jgi:hypothetical protein
MKNNYTNNKWTEVYCRILKTFVSQDIYFFVKTKMCTYKALMQNLLNKRHFCAGTKWLWIKGWVFLTFLKNYKWNNIYLIFHCTWSSTSGNCIKWCHFLFFSTKWNLFGPFENCFILLQHSAIFVSFNIDFNFV